MALRASGLLAVSIVLLGYDSRRQHANPVHGLFAAPRVHDGQRLCRIALLADPHRLRHVIQFGIDQGEEPPAIFQPGHRRQTESCLNQPDLRQG